MPKISRWIAALLVVCILSNYIPVPARAEMLLEETPEVSENQETLLEEDSRSDDPADDSPEQTLPEAGNQNDGSQTSGQQTGGEQTGGEQTGGEQTGGEPSDEEPADEELTDDSGPEILAEVETAAEAGAGDTPTEVPLTDAFAIAFAEVLRDNQYPEDQISQILKQTSDNVVTLNVPAQSQGSDSVDVLALLSRQTQTADCNYQNWNISFTDTGTYTFSDSFTGLGDPGFPFAGKFTGQSIVFNTSRTLFQALSTGADLNGIRINWTGSSQIPILTNTLVANVDEQINMPLASATAFSPYIGTLQGTGSVVLPSLNYQSAKTYGFSGPVGLLCCEMGEGSRLTLGTLTLDNKLTLNTSDGAVGALVGSMAQGAALTIAAPLTLDADLTGVNAGGLVGSMTNASIQMNADVSLSAKLTASAAAGGIAGVANVAQNPLSGTGTLTLSALVKGKENSGGLYGSCTVTGDFRMDGVNLRETTIEAATDGTATNCGGVFGTLTMTGSGICTLTGMTTGTTLGVGANAVILGGVTGILTGESTNNALVINTCTIQTKVAVPVNGDANYPKYLGGIAAKQTSATLDVQGTDGQNTIIQVVNPKVSTGGFGGLSAYVGENCLVRGKNLQVVTDGSLEQNKNGAGVALSVGEGTVVCLEGIIDLSGCSLSVTADSGVLVGRQNCSLVSGYGANIKRSGVSLDDIGNYGELYRVKDFLTINEDYSVSLKTLSSTEGVYVLEDATDYACLALAWQSRGHFPTVNGITKNNWNTLTGSAIELAQDIDLTGCGVGGLTRDTMSNEDTFTGTLNGGGYTLTLDIGRANQYASTVSTGDGRIYRHTGLGLFAQITDAARIENLTIGGSIRVANSAGTINCGGLAAKLLCRQAGSPLSGVSTEVAVNAQYATGKNQLYIGGLIGGVNGTASGTTTLLLDASLGAQITASVVNSGAYLHIGGAIGAMDASNVTIVCNGAVLTGGIACTGSTANLNTGGLVGAIFPKSGSNNRILLTDLTVGQKAGEGVEEKPYSISGSASARMGGILGGIWADTEVEVSGLKVEKAALTASGAAALGGLVYRASGQWTVSSADLSGLTIRAQNASALGLMVCKGGPDREMINNDTSYQTLSGLYLAMTEHWDWDDAAQKGYRVPTVSSFGGAVFDEFVAYTACADWSSGSAVYDITRNGAGIVSLKTNSGAVTMDGETRNTYVNRTGITQTNLHSRYYYNLPEVVGNCDGGAIDTPPELLIWSVNGYAASNLKQHFPVSGTTLGGASAASRADFDMVGLSYYPVSVVNSGITVQHADVKFYNAEIETGETIDPANKSTLGTGSSHSQHYTMHCGLFLNFTAENNSQKQTYKMTVNGVSFGGTVGMVNGVSGALICGTVRGENQSGSNPAVCAVILADEDAEQKAVTLAGIRVAGEGYRPVLIGSMGSYSELRANYLTTVGYQSGDTAGSSLVGAVGDSNATNITIAFAGTIRLPDKKADAVFTDATLLKSLQYRNGSATYQFYREKEYSGESYTHNATYGRELGEGVSKEYAGKEGCYNDGFGEYWYIRADRDFSAYLPYVAFSPASEDGSYPLGSAYHELAVNVHITDLLQGCGTYGHPYQVDATLLAEVAAYINGGAAAYQWKLRIPVANAEYHSADGDQDIILTYTDGWSGSHSDEDVRQHLAGAYYELVTSVDSAESTGPITLPDFSGLGTMERPFTGVIKGKTPNTRVVLTESSKSFINYSYGSVVRDLTIVLEQVTELVCEPWEWNAAKTAPKTFFGGVIGCVLGGDNILENVNVEGQNLKLTITDSAKKGHLVPVGGYVGVISGGGVLFRGTCAGGIPAGTSLYRNPIIGRVLNGYAFYEGSGTAPDNTDRNYKINTISTGGGDDLSWDGSLLTVENAQGLLLLSGIVSSGAGSTASDAYAKGKARLADYGSIGASTEPGDYAVACKDDGAVWANGQLPYLLSKYASYTGSTSICGSAIAMELVETGSYDMSGYGNGYRGLSARYASNSAFPATTTDGKNIVVASRVVLRLLSFNGNNAVVSGIRMNVQEYADDDFHAASVGGIFNILWSAGGTAAQRSAFAQNLTLEDCLVTMTYVDSGGNAVNQANTSTFTDAAGLSCVAVGGFAGSVSELNGTDSADRNHLLTNLHIRGKSNDERSTISGPNSAGGLIGASAMTNANLTAYPGRLLSDGKATQFGPIFRNCSYSDVNITAKLSAGGLIGEVFAGGLPNFISLGASTTSHSVGSFTSCVVTEEHFVVGQNATITAQLKGGVAGGFLGASGIRIRVNAPDMNAKTGLTVIPAGAERQPVVMRSVTVQACMENATVKTSSGSTNGFTNASQSVAGGCVGRIGSVNPAQFFDVHMDSCTVETGNHSTNSSGNNGEYAAGIVAMAYNNTSVRIEGCRVVNNSTINGQYSGGFVGLGYDSTHFNLHMKDSRIENSNVRGSWYAGGIVGKATSKYFLSNILIKNTSITSDTANQAGRLFGKMASSDFYVYATGISVCADPQKTVSVPNYIDGSANGGSYNGYVIYGDYMGLDTPQPESADPYVTANPAYELTTEKRVVGDAVGQIASDTSLKSVAAWIWDDNNTQKDSRKNQAVYVKATGDAPNVSTFHEIQGKGPEDLPVLVLKDSRTAPITNYLNILTNGGFAEAKRYGNVRYAVGAYVWDEDSRSFAKQAEGTKTSVYLYNNEVYVDGQNYDNGNSRFTLLEVTFQTKAVETNAVGGALTGASEETITYTIGIPIVVIRQLQYVYRTTLSYGKAFHAPTYDTLSNHVLESTGTPFTAYITYQYNRDQSMRFAEYDWQGYLDSGGDMLGIDKQLKFDTSSALPAGTQLTLLDCQNENRAYRYTTEGGNTVNLGQFRAVDDGSLFRVSMAEILGVTAEQNADGLFVLLPNAQDATVRLKTESGDYVYYRPATGADQGERYALTVPELDPAKNAKAEIPQENYFLVITVPTPEQDPNFYMNGFLRSSFIWHMPSEGRKLLRREDRPDTESNNESTYQISNGYTQNLISTAKEEFVNLSGMDRNMQVKLQDTIGFSNPSYGENDQLFLQFSLGLQEKSGKETLFPQGTGGTVIFHVMDADGVYYTYDAAGNRWTATGEKTAAFRYPWEWNSARGSMNALPLSADGKTPADLSGVRTLIQSKGQNRIIVTAEMDILMSEPLLKAVVPASDPNGLDDYTQLHYMAQLSTRAEALDYSTVRANALDEARYFRGVSYQAVLTMDASNISQLGINPLAPIPEYLTDGRKSRIDIVAALDLENLPNMDDILKNTSAITFTLSLYRRGNDQALTVDDRISFRWNGTEAGWSFTVPQSAYYDTNSNTVIAGELFNGQQFVIPLTAYVSMDTKEYANYRVAVRVEFEDLTPSVAINDVDAYIVYTYACIRPTFYERQ